MFWSAPKKKKDDEKEKQVKELKQVFPSIRRPNNDDNLFEIKFVVNNQYSSLRVFIPADFPSTRPGWPLSFSSFICVFCGMVANCSFFTPQCCKRLALLHILGLTSLSKSMGVKRYAVSSLMRMTDVESRVVNTFPYFLILSSMSS
jgi:hypothetical protein